MGVLTSMTMADELRAFLLAKGASLVGFADLRGIAPDVRDNLPFGISIAVALNHQVVAGIRGGPTSQYHAEYKRVNELVNRLGQGTLRFLEERGHKARWFAAAELVIDPDTLSTRLPHKTIATRAGLGWAGKCALLVTRAFGSAVRLTSVLTDAELPTGRVINTSRCGDCRACVDVCPGHAPSGRDWQINLSRDSFFDAFACRKAAREMAMSKLEIKETLCGMCIAACPWTQKYIERAG